MTKKKILLIHHSGLLGGAGISLYYTWLELQKEYEVTCYVPDDPPELKEFLLDQGLNPKSFEYRLGKITYYSGGNGLFNLKFWYHTFRIFIHKSRWEKILREEHADLVIVNAIVLSWFGIFSGKYKLMCFVRETMRGSRHSIPNLIQSKLLERFSLVSYLSDYDREMWQLSGPKSVVAHDFMEPEDFCKKIERREACEHFSLNPSAFNVLFLGGMNKLKGTEIALRSILSINDSEINLIIAGNNPGRLEYRSIPQIWSSITHFSSKRYHEKMRRLMSSELCRSNIKYLGVQRDVARLFDACDLLILPMIEPHQARPVFEFGAQSKTVVISDFDNLVEFVENEGNGLTFSPGDHEALGKCIRRLQQDPDLRSRMGSKNYHNAMVKHARVNVMKDLMRDIREVF